MTGMTQFGCTLAKLNIEILCANSSQAKGRVERANRTLQDRLVKELRFVGAASMEDGNAFLEGFMQRYNAKFAKAPAKPDSLYCGRRFRILNVIDDFSRECLAAVVDTSLSGQHDWIGSPKYAATPAWSSEITEPN